MHENNSWVVLSSGDWSRDSISAPLRCAQKNIRQTPNVAAPSARSRERRVSRTAHLLSTAKSLGFSQPGASRGLSSPLAGVLSCKALPSESYACHTGRRRRKFRPEIFDTALKQSVTRRVISNPVPKSARSSVHRCFDPSPFSLRDIADLLRISLVKRGDWTHMYGLLSWAD